MAVGSREEATETFAARSSRAQETEGCAIAAFPDRACRWRRLSHRRRGSRARPPRRSRRTRDWGCSPGAGDCASTNERWT